MKKLITLASVCAIGAAFAACDYVEKASSVYKWKFSGKTTFGTKPEEVKADIGYCGWDGSGGQGSDCQSVRAPVSLKIEGYTWYCEKDCGSDAFEQIACIDEIFWQKKPFKASLLGGPATDVSNIIGKKAKQFEAAGTATFTEYIQNGKTAEGTYTLTYAGLGKYDKKKNRVKSVSGNFAGFLDQPHFISNKSCVNAGKWDCAFALVCPGGTSVAYGKWSAKYQKSASKKFEKYGKLPKVPSWVVGYSNPRKNSLNANPPASTASASTADSSTTPTEGSGF